MDKITRREFLKISASSSAGLLISISLPVSGNEPSARTGKTGGFQPNAWIQITPDNTAIVTVAESEMGQGVMTSLPMLVAEELEMPLSAVKFSRAPVDPAFGYQSTVGSSSVRNAWPILRKAGATTRELFILAASRQWQVPRTECFAEAGMVRHRKSARALPYSDLLDAAAKLPPPEKVSLKKPEDFRIIGQPTPTLDAPLKITGKAVYGTDIILPGMLFARILHCPVFGGKLKSLDDTDALAISGVKHIVEISSGIAVVADNTWSAQKGLQALKIKWDFGKHAQTSSQSIRQDYQNELAKPGETLAHHGDPTSLASNTPDEQKLETRYTFPYVAHATMEPMCCTAYVRDGECDVWAPTQSPNGAQKTAAKHALPRHQQLLEKLKKKITGKSLQQIRIHTTFLGGGFGRRLQQDYVAEAVQISRATGKPIKLMWSREEDIQHDYYRPLTYHHLTGGIAHNGKPGFWRHRIVGASKSKSTWGATELPYDVDSFQVDFIKRASPVPIGSWRSVGNGHNAFVVETFIDELATLAREDPLAYRLKWMSDSPRLRAILELTAQKAGWGKQLPAGHYHGLAAHESFGSYVAQIVEISLDPAREIKVHKVTCGIDCGTVVNPNTVQAQIEGSVIFGLTACLKSAIDIKNGRVVQSNFHDFPVLRMPEAPKIEVHIMPGDASPSGVGEPAVPPVAPAVANAVFAATGKRIYTLPIRPQDLINI